jgi:hypothetical protein
MEPDIARQSLPKQGTAYSTTNDEPLTRVEEGAPGGPPLPVVMLRLTTGTWVSQAISVAARLGVADVLGRGPRASAEIAATVDAHGPTLYRLLRALADVGIVVELPDRRFALTPLGELLRTDVDGSMRGWATMIGLPFHRDAWTDLHASVRTGEPAFARVHGANLFDYLAAHPDDAAVFDAAMTSISTGFVSAIVQAYDFGRYSTVVDVGGGNGALLAAVLLANPDVRGVLVDRPDVLAGASAVLERAGVADRCHTVAGDFLDELPGSGNLYMLSNILHDWDDDTAVRILRTCLQAIPAHGRLLIVELVLPDGTEPSLAKLLDLEMLAMAPGGRQRTASEYTHLLTQAGLRLTHVVTATPGQAASYVEAAPNI